MRARSARISGDRRRERHGRLSISLAALALALFALLAPAVDAEVVQRGNLRVTFEGSLSPKTLPRADSAPVRVSVGGHITTTDGSPPPELRSLEIQINRHGVLDPAALPTCPLPSIQPASTRRALTACRTSLVGQGRFTADSLLAGSSLPTQGRLLLFNGREGGSPVLLGHIYSTRPFAFSAVIPFRIRRKGRGTFGTDLTADLAASLGGRIQLTGIEMSLGIGGRGSSYLQAGCPAPKGFPGASFPLARASFFFPGGRTLAQTLVRGCQAR